MASEIKNKNWFRRHWIISIFLGLTILGMIGNIFDPETDKSITGEVVNKQVIDSFQEEVVICNSDWNCNSWSECNSSEIQIRTCTDSNNCGTNLGKPSEIQTCIVPKAYIKKTYDDTCMIFDYGSKYTDIQKEKIFKEEYEGKYVEWTGNIQDIDVSILNNLRLNIKMSCGTGKIYMNQDQYDKLILLNKGEEVTFNGRFDIEPKLKLFGGIHFVLKDGELVKQLKETSEPKPEPKIEEPLSDTDSSLDDWLDGLSQVMEDIDEALEDLEEQQDEQIAKLIKTPDTGNVLISLEGSKIVNGDCSIAKPFKEYGVSLPENCKGVWSTNVANYCELGNRIGENVNNYYCRPERFIDCNTISSSGEIEDVKRYGITKVLQCDGENEKLIDIIVRI